MSGLSFLLFFKQVQARVTIFIQPVGSAEPAKDLTTTNNMQSEAETSIPRTIVNIGIRHKSVALNKTCRSEIYLILD